MGQAVLQLLSACFAHFYVSDFIEQVKIKRENKRVIKNFSRICENKVCLRIVSLIVRTKTMR